MRVGDLLGISGSEWLSQRIIAATQIPGTSPAPLSHVGVCTADTPFEQITEALTRVVTRPLADSIAAAKAAWSLEWVDILDEQREEIAYAALAYSAKDYGYIDIAYQGLDSMFQTRWFTEHFAERKLPICSMLDAIAVTKAGLLIGLDPKSATPNDIWRYAAGHPDVLRMARLK